jgi:uncharacterized protein YbbC (DUF1343 family)
MRSGWRCSFLPASFQPTFQKMVSTMCGGIQIHVKDRRRFEPYLTGISVISTARSLYPEAFQWRNPPYEYENEKLPIEILCGSNTIPAMMQCETPVAQIRRSWQEDVSAFRKQREPYLLYG